MNQAKVSVVAMKMFNFHTTNKTLHDFLLQTITSAHMVPVDEVDMHSQYIWIFIFQKMALSSLGHGLSDALHTVDKTDLS